MSMISILYMGEYISLLLVWTRSAKVYEMVYVLLLGRRVLCRNNESPHDLYTEFKTA